MKRPDARDLASIQRALDLLIAVAADLQGHIEATRTGVGTAGQYRQIATAANKVDDLADDLWVISNEVADRAEHFHRADEERSNHGDTPELKVVSG